jgi:broad specificity phosphatase PhoE
MNNPDPNDIVRGDATLELIERAFDQGASHVAVLMRHSAREFVPGRHDLLNPLTDEGRALARRMGERLPKSALVRAYASPADRCMETAALLLAGHEGGGGRATRHRAVEALGVFYVLDQMRMYKSMTEAAGQARSRVDVEVRGFLDRWFDGAIEPDVMMPPEIAARLVATVVASKLSQPVARPQLDLCVSHDMTLYLVRARLLGLRPAAAEVDFLDGLVFYSGPDGLTLAAADGSRTALSLAI